MEFDNLEIRMMKSDIDFGVRITGFKTQDSAKEFINHILDLDVIEVKKLFDQDNDK